MMSRAVTSWKNPPCEGCAKWRNVLILLGAMLPWFLGGCADLTYPGIRGRWTDDHDGGRRQVGIVVFAPSSKDPLAALGQSADFKRAVRIVPLSTDRFGRFKYVFTQADGDCTVYLLKSSGGPRDPFFAVRFPHGMTGNRTLVADRSAAVSSYLLGFWDKDGIREVSEAGEIKRRYQLSESGVGGAPDRAWARISLTLHNPQSDH